MFAFIGFLTVCACILFLGALLIVNVANLTFSESFDLGPCGTLEFEVGRDTPFLLHWSSKDQV